MITDPLPSTQTHRLPARTRIRRAAVEAFAKNGFNATGIREVATLAGVTSSTLYHYAESKEQLLVDIMLEGHLALLTATQNGLRSAATPEQQLATLVAILVATHATNPLTTRVVDSEIRSLEQESIGRRKVVELRDEYELLWKEALDAGAEAGIFHIEDRHISRLAIITMCTGMSYWYRRELEHDLPELVKNFINLSLGAVRASRGSHQITAADMPKVDLSAVPNMTSEPPLDRI